MTPNLLIEQMIDRGVLKTPRIVEAFRRVDRKLFVPEDLRDRAYIDEPLPLGFGSTISQPSTVAFLLELLNPEPGQKILDIGSGSGWQAALIGHIVSHDDFGKALPKERSGKVIGIERIPEIGRESIARLSQLNFIKRGIVDINIQNGEGGYQKEAPYDSIIAAAMVRDLPERWIEQLKDGGCIVYPKKMSIVKLQKKGENDFVEEVYEGYIFVPFIKKEDDPQED